MLPMPSRNIRLRQNAGALFLLALLILPVAAQANAAQDNSRYDVLYIWDPDLRNLQDYKEELETQLGAEVGKALRIIQRGDRYGLIYDCNTTALSSAKMAVRHSVVLGKAGLGDARAIKDEDYHELYNVCYGHGPNLAALTAQYQTIYRQLGAEVGKDLFIEKSGDGKYTLVYRKQTDKQSTMGVARHHAKLLAKSGIAASITREENNEVVFGESSLLDHEEKDMAADPAPVPSLADTKKTPAEPVPLLTGNKKKSIAETVANADRNLEQELEEYINELRGKGLLAKDEKTGWLVIDLNKGETIVDINVDNPYQAASMIKPFVALAYFHRFKEGKLKYTPTARSKMEAMIQYSNNDATNWVLKQVGGPRAAQKILRQHYGHLLRETSLVEYIPSGGRTYRNKASAKDYGRFLVALWRKQLPHDEEIRRLMSLPGRDRLYSGTQIPQGTLVYNKTGTTAQLCGDMGILAPKGQNGRRYPYVVVGIIEKQSKAGNYGRWKMERGNVIRRISSMIYQKMKANYNLL
ncbi:MAG: serine hydrolase [Desulfurivibrionaceae bacterium]|nr:serine hydrolase [Desulfurivibrionaceae bacterium]